MLLLSAPAGTMLRKSVLVMWLPLVQETCWYGQTNLEKPSPPQAIGVVDMTFADCFQGIMRGHTVCIDKYSLLFFLDHQNELGINTLLVQKRLDGKYICKVDELTSKHFIEKYPVAPPYEIEESQI